MDKQAMDKHVVDHVSDQHMGNKTVSGNTALGSEAVDRHELGSLALIVLNYNSSENTITCTDQLLSFASSFHIVIVDNMSPNGGFQELKEKYKNEKNVDVIQTKANKGYSAGNNYGIRFAIKKYGVDTIGILNPDVLIPKFEVLQVLMEKLYSDDSYAVIGGSTLDIEGNYNPNNSGWYIPTLGQLIGNHFLINNRKSKKWEPEKVAPDLVRVDCVAGCFFLAKVKAMEEVSFLDENVFLYNEENILGIKLKRKGYKEVIATDQFYYHNHKHSDAPIPFKKKVLATKNTYESRKYLCKTFYTPVAVPLLWCVEMVNRVYLAGCYVKGKLKR